MKKIPVEESVGSILCHDMTRVNGTFKGRWFQKGHVIEKKDIPVLLDMGKKHIYIWEEHENQIHEDQAAIRLAAMSNPPYTSYSGPMEGKMTLNAVEDGLFVLNKKLLNQLNCVEDITISTIPNHYPVCKGMRLATQRIVPLVTKESNIQQAEALCANEEQPLFQLFPYQRKKVGVIITGSEVYHGRIEDKFEAVIRKKLEAFPCETLGISKSDDDLEMLHTITQKYLQAGAEILIYSGGMSVDPDDLTPTAIRSVGAHIVTHGIPAQPGNMLMIGYKDETALIGVPGAAIFHEITILDGILPQLFTPVKFQKEDIVAMGDGGVCLGCADCHFPACSFGKY